MASIAQLTKTELLIVLESVPQELRPPRPTRQDKTVLVDRIRSAHFLGGEKGDRVRKALADAWQKRAKRG